MPPLKLKVALAGLGRMGKLHSQHFLNRTPRATLIAASTPDPAEVRWAQEHLCPFGVRIYKSYDEMLEKEKELEAVVIASVTTVHAEQTIRAIEQGLHVLCEKPLSTLVEVSQKVVDAANKRPDLKVMCGFSRRFDPSYLDAHQKISAGLIGRPSVIRSQTCDKLDPSGFFVEYSKFSGGIFVDCSIHDIDLVLWFFGEDSIVKSVCAAGITAVQPDLQKYGDSDNAVGVVEFYGGKIAQLFCSRMMAAGQEDTTEIIGTEGKLTVNAQPAKNLVSIHDKGGIRRELPADFHGRFEQAFLNEAKEFAACCLDDRKLPLTLEGAVKAIEIGSTLMESLRTGKKISFNEAGKRIETAQL